MTHKCVLEESQHKTGSSMCQERSVFRLHVSKQNGRKGKGWKEKEEKAFAFPPIRQNNKVEG